MRPIKIIEDNFKRKWSSLQSTSHLNVINWHITLLSIQWSSVLLFLDQSPWTISPWLSVLIIKILILEILIIKILIFQRTSSPVWSSTKMGSCWPPETRGAGLSYSRWNFIKKHILHNQSGDHNLIIILQRDAASKSSLPRRGEYNVYSTFQV